MEVTCEPLLYSNENREKGCQICSERQIFDQQSLSIDKNSYSNECMPMALRRIGPDPHENGAQTEALKGCPDIFELENGDFAIVGHDAMTLVSELPAGASCGPDERIIVIPRKTLVLARPHIPEKL
jgi:hypothetical protein